MKKQQIFKLEPYDEVNDIWLLKEKEWWIFYTLVSSGSKKELTKWVEKKGGVLISS